MVKSVIPPEKQGTAFRAAQAESQPRPDPILAVLKAVASLRVTVALFALAVVLVFCGTLAQIDEGIWTVLRTYFRSAVVWIPFQILVEFGQIFFQWPARWRLAGSFPFPGGWLIGSLLLVNLLAAHAIRFRLSWKRSGILILHSGLIILMVGEFVTGMMAVEGNMTIETGGTSNFLEHREYTELAFVTPDADPSMSDVVVIPGARLKRGGLIQDNALPFDVQVDRYMVNSATPHAPAEGVKNPATAGDGLALIAEERPVVSGADPNQRLDLASAYVTLKKKGTGESLGTYLVSLWFSISDRTQAVTVDGKEYAIDLRFKRTYKPYTMHLLEFHHDLYIGTDTPKNFSSKVRLTDPTRNEDREVVISMNHPLRYAGETFYQSGWIPGDKGTILQVVHNPGWLMPYISCFLVTLGMVVHFLLHLIGFLRRRAAV